MNNAKQIEIRDAKRRLFQLLHAKSVDNLTLSEIDIAYYLSKDEDIQNVFDESVKSRLKNLTTKT